MTKESLQRGHEISLQLSQIEAKVNTLKATQTGLPIAFDIANIQFGIHKGGSRDTITINNTVSRNLGFVISNFVDAVIIELENEIKLLQDEFKSL